MFREAFDFAEHFDWSSLSLLSLVASGKKHEEPPAKKQKTETPVENTEEKDIFDDSGEDSTNDNQLSEGTSLLTNEKTIENQEQCYFHKIRKTPQLETQERTTESSVSTDCSVTLKSMKLFVDDQTGRLYGARNQLDLILCRGAGKCNEDFDDDSVVADWTRKHICENHLSELLTDWDKKKYQHIKWNQKRGTVNMVCSMPSGYGMRHVSRPMVRNAERVLKDEARGMLQLEGILLHPGLPVCANHKQYVSNSNGQSIVENTGHNIEPAPEHGLLSQSSVLSTEAHYSCRISQDLTKDPDFAIVEAPKVARMDTTVDHEVKHTMYAFADAGKEGTMVRRRKNFALLDGRTKQKKARSLRNLINLMCQTMAPDDPKGLCELALVSSSNEVWLHKQSDDLSKVMSSMSEAFFTVGTRTERIDVLSLVADVLPIAKVREFIPGLTSHMYYCGKYRARRRKNNLPKEAQEHKKQRFDPTAVNYFIQYITGGAVMTGLPFSSLNTKRSDGIKIIIPSVIRQLRDTEVIIGYEKYMIETNNEQHLLSRSTLQRILNVCVAKRRTASTCVDYFLADALEGFETLIDIVQKLEAHQLISVEWAKTLRNGLKQGSQYLGTDYRIHAKKQSRTADHCSQYALSDYDDSRLSTPCSEEPDQPHQHDIKCDRCESLKTVLGDLRDSIIQLTEENKDNLQNLQLLKEINIDLNNADASIIEFKKHQLRSTYTELIRRDIVEDLKEDSALITLDYAQKFLPTHHRERQSDYFGKRGISYHISHVLTKMGSNYATHSYVHIVRDDPQNSNSISLILTDMLPDLRKMGINQVYLRSDNAGNYHASSLMASLPNIATTTGVSIRRYTFSETQNGKSASDRVASHVKRKVRDWVDQGQNARTADEFYTAITSGRLLSGITVRLCNIQSTKKSTTTFPKISTLYDFELLDNGIQSYQYYKMGSGVFAPLSSLEPNEGFLNVEKEGGITSSQAKDYAEEQRLVKTGQNSYFWYSKQSVVDQCEEESKEPVDDDDLNSLICTQQQEKSLFECPQTGCTASFLSYITLQNHVERGNHRHSAERQTLRDHALNTYIQTLENVGGFSPDESVKTAILQTKHTTLDTSVNLKRGWALRTRKTSKRFSDGIKQFLNECFQKGEHEKKMDSRDVETLIKTAIDDKGELRFTPEERVNYRQIEAFFSRLKKSKTQTRTKRSIGKQKDFDINDEEGDLELEYRKEPHTLFLEDELRFIIEENKEEIFDTSI